MGEEVRFYLKLTAIAAGIALLLFVAEITLVALATPVP